MTGTTAHLSEAEIVGTALGDLSAEACARRDAHALDCVDCARQIERLRARRPRPRVAPPLPSGRPEKPEFGAEEAALLRALAAPRTFEQLAAEHAVSREAFVERVHAVRRVALDECPRQLQAAIVQVEHSTGVGLDPLHVGLYRAVFMHDDEAAFRRMLKTVAYRIGSECPPEWSVEPASPARARESHPRARRVRPIVLLTAVGGWLAAAVALLTLRPTPAVPTTATDPDVRMKGAVVAPSLTVACVPPEAKDQSEIIYIQDPTASCPRNSEIGAKVTIPSTEWQTLVVVFSQAGYKDTVMHRQTGTLQTIEFDPETSPEGRRILVHSKVAVSLLSSRGPNARVEHRRVVISPQKDD